MNLAETAVKKAEGLGATEAEAFVLRTRTMQIEFNDVIESIKTVESTGLGLRVALGRRTAMYSTSIIDEDEIQAAAERAVSIAKVTPEDPHWEHLNKKYGRSTVVGTYDPAIEGLAYEDVVDRIISAVDLMKERDPRVKPTMGLLSLSNSNITVANSYDESLHKRGTYATAWVTAKAEEVGMESTGGESWQTRRWDEIDLETMAVAAADKAIGFLRAKPIPGGDISVIVRNQVFAGILGVMLSNPISADTVQKGGSPLAGRLGEELASDDITIVDDGLMKNGWMTRPFDDEGHPTLRTPIIENGTLRNFLYDNYTSIIDHVNSTGNARRAGYSSPPTPAPNNLVLEKGTASREEIIQDTRHGIYVEDVIGEWLSNPVSGNLNATVTHGYLVEDGELADPVKGVVLSGNFYDLLKDGFEIIGNDTRNNGGNYSPTVKIAQLTIAGE